MLETLVSTKFYNPLTIGRLTQRPQLDARLDESLQAGCRLVTAPAEYALAGYQLLHRGDVVRFQSPVSAGGC